jgi:glycosyltransferase involved in cell wall biosynthesis
MAICAYAEVSLRMRPELFRVNILRCSREIGLSKIGCADSFLKAIRTGESSEHLSLKNIEDIAQVALRLENPLLFHWCSILASKNQEDHVFSFENSRLSLLRADLFALYHYYRQSRSHNKERRNSKDHTLVYFVHASLPHTRNGYTSRSQGVLEGLSFHGIKTFCHSRPGFPVDIIKNLDGYKDRVSMHDGISYYHSLKPVRGTSIKSLNYIIDASEEMARIIDDIKPACVIAASNYVTALPALIAARKNGTPCAYEVRGFWEISELAKTNRHKPDFEYYCKKYIESCTAISFDQVFTIANTMAKELVSRGVEPSKISIVPNGFSQNKFRMLPINKHLRERLGIPRDAFVVGYAGSIVEYEGIDDLAQACINLSRQGLEIYLIIIGSVKQGANGNNSILEAIRHSFAAAGITDRLKLIDHVDQSRLAEWYSLFDVSPIPRKDYEVTNIVAPLKPVEAMSMGRTLLVSSCPALTENVSDGQTGLVFERGNINDLMKKLSLLASNKDLRLRLANKAYNWVLRNRKWSDCVEPISKWLESQIIF